MRRGPRCRGCSSFDARLPLRHEGDPDELQQDRGAAEPPAGDPPQPRESGLFVGGPNEPQYPPHDGSPGAVESNASNYGGAAIGDGATP